MLLDAFTLLIAYSQISVFTANLFEPFNNWRPQHLSQGFSWRPQSVSFRTLEEVGQMEVKVFLENEIRISSDAVRAIQVPFSVNSSEGVEVSSIDKGQLVKLPPGGYTLVFETGYNEHLAMWCNFNFISQASALAKILRSDARLSPTYPLGMAAHPA